MVATGIRAGRLLRHRWLLLAAVVLIAALFWLRPWYHAALLLLDAAEMQGLVTGIPHWSAPAIETDEVHVDTRYGRIPGRVYRIPGSEGSATVLIHGLHAAGISEERLGPFARQLAARGMVVLTPEMEELRRYRITPETTDKIEDSVSWLAGERRFSRGRRIAMIGISYSGGLSVVAAGRSAIRDRVSFVLSIGGHGDMVRAGRFLCTGELPGGAGYLKPHDYGLGILLLNLADRLVPQSQSRRLIEGISAYLQEDYAKGRETIAELQPPASQILKWVDTRDSARVAPLLLPELDQFASNPSLSPERSASPRAPVFLLHGRDDSLIPAAETRLLADYLLGKTEVHALVTPLISHVELERAPRAVDLWKLLRFWAGIFSVA
ncbi:MAG: alpha/beta hydrolase [Acidobacteria bacterium]|nr:alpha/beta hydrolase [Acidobacteriota bacterium]